MTRRPLLCCQTTQASSPSRQWGSQPLGPFGPHGRPPRPAARTRRSSAGRLPGLGLHGARVRAGSVAPCLGLGVVRPEQRSFAPIAPPKRRSRSLDGLLDEPDLALGPTSSATPTPATTATPTPTALLASPNWPGVRELSDREDGFGGFPVDPSPDRLSKSQSCEANLDLDDESVCERPMRETLPCADDNKSAEDTELGGVEDRKRNFMDRCVNKMLSFMKK
ncbi:hypothetical protein FOCC_FOCC011705 [Frankliniella occidentalis]|nr:hypothetical protein FOCC_FOCC011705 [Frankliniella occidentalis]